MAKKLVCDRCGMELTDKYDVEMVLEGKEAWEAAVRAGGAEPRGIYPCQDFNRCGGEMQVVNQRRQWIAKLISR